MKKLFLRAQHLAVVLFALWCFWTTARLSVGLDLSSFNWISCSLLAVGMLGTQLLVVEVTQHNGERDRVFMSSTWIVAMAITSPVMMTLSIAVAASLLGDWRSRRLEAMSAVRAAQMVAAAGVTYIIYSLGTATGVVALEQTRSDMMSTITTICAAMAFYLICNYFAFTEEVLREQMSVREYLRDCIAVHGRLSLVLVLTGPLITLASEASWLAVVLGCTPTVAVWYAMRLLERSQHDATHDALTGLGNRSFFWSRFDHSVDKARRSGTKLAVAMLDVDHFKRINDTLGHDVGDLVISEVAHRLNTLPHYTEAFRLGGDEFTLLIHDASDEQIDELGKDILALIGQPITGNDPKSTRLMISTSVGIAMLGRHGDDSRTLLKSADTALYQAKETRNDVCIYDPHWQSSDHEDLELIADMHEAVSGSNFMVYYQPKVDAQTSEPIGVEALLRWVHPTRGFVSPDVFIPLAESTGLILPMSERALRDALLGLATMHNSGHEIDLSVNFSARLLSTPYVLEWVDEALASAGISPSRLILEVTESTLIEESERTLETISGLRQRGIRISIDDYGTGFSTPQRMQALRPDELKIDKCYVMDYQSAVSRNLITSAMSMCAELDVKVVAEGVETEEVATYLRELGCDIFQGYLYAKPMPLHQTIGWMNEHHSARSSELV